MEEIVEVLWVGLLLFCLWFFGALAEEINCPALIAEIVVGCVLGPEILDVVPEVEGIKLVGLLGLLLIVLEGGLHIELTTMQSIGRKAAFIAVSGTTLPVLLSLAVLPRFYAFSNLEGLIAGVSLSSTAIGMAAKLMQSLDLLRTHIGKLITCAAMIDDVASLVLLAVISNTVSGDGEAGAVVWAIALPIISSLTFIVISTYISFHMTSFIEKFRIRLHPNQPCGDPTNFSPVSVSDPLGALPGCDTMASTLPTQVSGDSSRSIAWDVTLIRLLLFVAVVFTGIAHYVRTTFLLGAFMAGVAFSSVPGMHESWSTHMPTVATWTARLFFASIGFTIPVRELFSVEALYFGLLLTLIAIASKVATGIFEWDDKWAIGWAMVGRGELGFVMAEEAFRNDLTSKLTYSVTVWALLLATLLSPVAFRKALSSHHQMSPEVVKSPNLSKFDNEGQVEVVAVVDSKCEKVL